MGYLLILLNNALTAIHTVFNKEYLKRSFRASSGLDIYILLAHPIAAMYFLLMAGGNVPLNLPSALFAAVYAALCLLSVIFSMTALVQVNLIYISVFSGAGGVVLPFLFDLLAGGQSFAVTRLLAVLVRLCAIIVPLMTSKEELKNLLICIFLFLISGGAAILPRLYSAYPGVVSDNSFCFWTNVFILPIASFAVLKKNGLKKVAQDMKKISRKGYLCIFGATACANIGALLTLQILRLVNVSVYAVVSGSVGMLLTVLLSTLAYKEKFTIRSAISVVCSVTAVVLGVL